MYQWWHQLKLTGMIDFGALSRLIFLRMISRKATEQALLNHSDVEFDYRLAQGR
jgi:hypothetical protein